MTVGLQERGIAEIAKPCFEEFDHFSAFFGQSLLY